MGLARRHSATAGGTSASQAAAATGAPPTATHSAIAPLSLAGSIILGFSDHIAIGAV